MSPTIISIEGNIGSGKSTLVTSLKQHFTNWLPISFVDEPVQVWSNIKDTDGESILEKFYADQKSYSFSFQMMAYISRVSALREAVRNNPDGIIITERSVQTDRNVFAKMLYDQGQIREVDYQIYLKWFDEFSSDLPINGIVYVNTSPETCEARVIKRAREGEAIPLAYLQQCSNYHHNWIVNFETDRVCELDGNQNIHQDPMVMSQWLAKISSFIGTDQINTTISSIG